jgi:hypothetical protein
MEHPKSVEIIPFVLSCLNISPLPSGVDVIEIVYDIYAISNSGPPRDAYKAELGPQVRHLRPHFEFSEVRLWSRLSGSVVGACADETPND